MSEFNLTRRGFLKLLFSSIGIISGFPLFRISILKHTHNRSTVSGYGTGKYGSGKYSGYHVYLPQVNKGG